MINKPQIARLSCVIAVSVLSVSLACGQTYDKATYIRFIADGQRQISEIRNTKAQALAKATEFSNANIPIMSQRVEMLNTQAKYKMDMDNARTKFQDQAAEYAEAENREYNIAMRQCPPFSESRTEHIRRSEEYADLVSKCYARVAKINAVEPKSIAQMQAIIVSDSKSEEHNSQCEKKYRDLAVECDSDIVMLEASIKQWRQNSQ